MENSSFQNQGNKEFVLTRILNAPRSLVFKTWAEPEHLAKWWGPKGFTFLTAKMDFRPGGIFHYGMKSPDGNEMWGKLLYHEIVAPEMLTYIVSFSDKDGNTTRHPLSPIWPLEVMNIMTLTEQGDKTLLTLRGYPVNATIEEVTMFHDNHKNMEAGFGGMFSQYEEYLASIIKE